MPDMRQCKGCNKLLKLNKFNKHELMCNSCFNQYKLYHDIVEKEMRALYEQEFDFCFAVPGSGVK